MLREQFINKDVYVYTLYFISYSLFSEKYNSVKRIGKKVISWPADAMSVTRAARLGVTMAPSPATPAEPSSGEPR